jgi:rhomboid protease GluP
VQVPLAQPFWTYVILAINILAFIAMLAFGPSLVLGLGDKNNAAIVAGQVWRLLTSMFLHVDLLHIGFNSYALWIFGPQVERPYGRLRFLAIYLLSGLAGSALSFMLSSRNSVGASGAIFGLIGVTGAYLYRYRNQFTTGRARLTRIFSIAAYNLIYGFVVPGIDNWAHIGGLLAGLVLGWFLAPRYRLTVEDSFSAPRLVDDSPLLQWLIGVIVVGLGIGIAVAGGALRWSMW